MLTRLALMLVFVMPVSLLPGVARALDLSIPGSPTLTREIVEDPGSYRLPVGPYEDGAMRTLRIDGRIIQQAWRLEGQSMTTAQIFGPLRAQIEAQGFDILLDCAGRSCGGFDFRFNTRVMAAPDMFVDLFDYRFLSARKDTAQDAGQYVSVLVSRSGSSGYVQIIQVGGAAIRAAGDQTRPAPARPDTGPAATGPFEARLLRDGHVVLSDLDFGTGASELSDASYPSLEALGVFLRGNPERRIALVGHTDSVGGLEGNRALSRRRAASVLERLASRHDVPRAQMESAGIAYLAPVASNLTASGREANRRVEAVLLAAE